MVVVPARLGGQRRFPSKGMRAGRRITRRRPRAASSISMADRAVKPPPSALCVASGLRLFPLPSPNVIYIFINSQKHSPTPLTFPPASVVQGQGRQRLPTWRSVLNALQSAGCGLHKPVTGPPSVGVCFFSTASFLPSVLPSFLPPTPFFSQALAVFISLPLSSCRRHVRSGDGVFARKPSQSWRQNAMTFPDASFKIKCHSGFLRPASNTICPQLLPHH